MNHITDVSTMKRRRRRLKTKNFFYPLSNFDILNLAAELKIPHFHGVYMRDKLLEKSRPKTHECWVINHGSSHTDGMYTFCFFFVCPTQHIHINTVTGTHWTALVKNDKTAYYFDSFGNLAPPLEVIAYLGPDINIFYNVKRYQKYGTTICGHLCLKFLYDFWKSRKKKCINTRSQP